MVDARRPADPGVPAARLRRRGRPRRGAVRACSRGTIDVRVHCFDGPRDEPGVTGYAVPAELAGANAALQTFGVDLEMADATCAAARDRSGPLAHLVRQPRRAPRGPAARHPARRQRPQPRAAAALEGRAARRRLRACRAGPRRPRTRAPPRSSRSAAACATTSCAAYPAVDPARVNVVHNGIDLDQWQRRPRRGRRRRTRRARLGIDPSRPAVVFVGRITRQKGLPYFLRAAELLPPDVQVVLCAGAPGHAADHGRGHAGWSSSCGPARRAWSGSSRCCRATELIAVLTHGTVFVCPSIYEPLGIVNLEAMAVRAAGGRHGHRRHPGGRRRRRHRPAGADRPAAGRHRHAGRPGPVRRRPRRRAHRRASANTARHRAVGRGLAAGGSRTTSRGRRSPSARSRSTGRSGLRPALRPAQAGTPPRPSRGGPSGRPRAGPWSAGRPATG